MAWEPRAGRAVTYSRRARDPPITEASKVGQDSIKTKTKTIKNQNTSKQTVLHCPLLQRTMGFLIGWKASRTFQSSSSGASVSCRNS